ncbi:hypothetical protein [Pseudomonas sp. Hp2]|uniref:hypothetical protein n=1 Tax=Pseudomonas sp. Hp2 TaxID=701189 RepID=UPI00112D79E5|nr:hypothetical protein [Pseudomonas sp. Hp2]
MTAKGESTGGGWPPLRFVHAVCARLAGLRRWWLARGLNQVRFLALPMRSAHDEALIFPPADSAQRIGTRACSDILESMSLQGAAMAMCARLQCLERQDR